MGYAVASSPRSIVESAAARGFQKCTALLPLCLNAKDLPSPSKTQDKLLTLIQAFQGEWGWSKADIGRAMQHTLTEFKNNSTPPGADVQGPVAPDEVMDFAMALQAMDDGATDPAATDANAVDATVEVPGVGPVNVALLQALNGPLSPPRGTDDRFMQQQSVRLEACMIVLSASIANIYQILGSLVSPPNVFLGSVVIFPARPTSTITSSGWEETACASWSGRNQNRATSTTV